MENNKDLQDVLIYIRNILLQDMKENYKYERTLTTLDCWIEDIDIELDDN